MDSGCQLSHQANTRYRLLASVSTSHPYPYSDLENLWYRRTEVKLNVIEGLLNEIIAEKTLQTSREKKQTSKHKRSTELSTDMRKETLYDTS